MKNFIAICFCFLLGCVTSVSFGADNPNTGKHLYNNECSVFQNQDVTVNAYEFSPDRYSGSEFLYSRGYSISENSTGLTLNFAIVTDPLTLKRWDTKFKVNESINYKEPFVDTSYIWKYSVHFNC